MKVVFVIDEFPRREAGRFEAHLEDNNQFAETKGHEYGSLGETVWEAIANLATYLNKDDHSDEIWMAYCRFEGERGDNETAMVL